MFLNKKGQTDPKWIIYVVVAVMISVLVLALWSWVSEQAFPTSPEEYAQAWAEYGEYAFDMSGDDQPWRLMAIFFFPLMIYFSLFFASICLVFAKGNLGGQWDLVQKPFVIFSFSVAFIILPFPTTFALYQALGGLSIMVIVFAWAAGLGAMFILFNHMGKHFSLGDGGGKRDTRRWFQGRKEKEESDVDKLRREANGLINETRKFMGDCNNVIQEKDRDSAVSYMTFINKLGERIDNLINEIEGSELPDYEKFSYRRTLEPLTGQLEKLYERLDELKGKEETTEEEKKEKNEKILNDLINVAKKAEEGINKVKKEKLSEDLRKYAEKIEDLRKKLEQTENYEERVKIGIELQELLKSFKGKSEEGEKQVEKEEEKKEEDERTKKLRAEFHRALMSIDKAAKICQHDIEKFTSEAKTSGDERNVSNELYDKAKELSDENKRLIKKCKEMRAIFWNAKTFENALQQYLAKGYFGEMKDMLNNMIDAISEFSGTYRREANKKIEREEDGKVVEKTYVEAFPRMYNVYYSNLIKKFKEYHDFLIVIDKRLMQLNRLAASRES